MNNIALYLAKEANEDIAHRFVVGVEKTYKRLSVSPGIGHTPYFDDIDGLETIRIEGFPQHQAFYTVGDDEIYIRRVLHSHRDMPKFLSFLDQDEGGL